MHQEDACELFWRGIPHVMRALVYFPWPDPDYDNLCLEVNYVEMHLRAAMVDIPLTRDWSMQKMPPTCWGTSPAPTRRRRRWWRPHWSRRIRPLPRCLLKEIMARWAVHECWHKTKCSCLLSLSTCYLWMFYVLSNLYVWWLYFWFVYFLWLIMTNMANRYVN